MSSETKSNSSKEDLPPLYKYFYGSPCKNQFEAFAQCVETKDAEKCLKEFDSFSECRKDHPEFFDYGFMQANKTNSSTNKP